MVCILIGLVCRIMPDQTFCFLTAGCFQNLQARLCISVFDVRLTHFTAGIGDLSANSSGYPQAAIIFLALTSSD